MDKNHFKFININNEQEQKGSKHYHGFKIQPHIFSDANELLFAEGNVIKYVCRHRLKDGEKDIDKAIHYLEMIKERDYNVKR